MIEFTDWAKQILRNSVTNSRRFNPDARVRIANIRGAVQAEFTDSPEPGDLEVEVEPGVVVIVEGGLEGLVDVQEPHDQLVLKPAGSHWNDPGHHLPGGGSG